jgi:hypothetical protein
MVRNHVTTFSANGRIPNDKKIWCGIRSEDIPRKHQDFLFRIIHGAYKIGDYWSKIPNYGDRGICKLCGCTESMEHILLECKTQERKIIWKVAENFFKQKYDTWTTPTLGMIIGALLVSIMKDGKPHKGTSRLLRRTLLESAWLIWVL